MQILTLWPTLVNRQSEHQLSEDFPNVVTCIELGSDVHVRQIVVHLPFTLRRSRNHDEAGIIKTTLRHSKCRTSKLRQSHAF